MTSQKFLWTLFLLFPGCAPAPVLVTGDIAHEIQDGISHGTAKFDHGQWDVIVRQHASNEETRFEYSELKKHESDLDEYLAKIQGVRLSSLSRDQLLALLINAYNAYTVKTILETITVYRPAGVPSIRDVPGAFTTARHRVGGHSVSLDAIERDVIRPIFKDARVHFALGCASISCPALPPWAFTGEEIDRQLEAVVARALTSPRFVKIDGGKLFVNRLFDRYREDFVNPDFNASASSIAAFVARHARPAIRRWIESRKGNPEIRFLADDWRLNKS